MAEFRDYTFFMRDGVRFGINRLTKMGILNETSALAHGFEVINGATPTFDKYTHIPKDIGVLNGSIQWELVPLLPAALAEQLKVCKRDRINDFKKYANDLFLKGVTSDALGIPHVYDTDKPLDLINMQSMKMAGVPAMITCTSPDGIKMPRQHTSSQISQVYEKYTGTNGIQATFWQTALAIEAATTAEKVRAVVWGG